MKFMVNIHTDNEAFDYDPSQELARLLRKIADELDAGGDYAMFQTIRDINGNDVGAYALKPEDYV
jgi:hypothetical protein